MLYKNQWKLHKDMIVLKTFCDIHQLIHLPRWRDQHVLCLLVEREKTLASPYLTSQLCLLSHILHTGPLMAAWTKSVPTIFMYWSIRVAANDDPRNSVCTCSETSNQSNSRWRSEILTFYLSHFTKKVVWYFSCESAVKVTLVHTTTKIMYQK